ncbi:MAG: sugar ABC transporter permease [Proteobacteria bacterium]|nr:sugar ABC transporter permease [Pseudomonadota bacterium]
MRSLLRRNQGLLFALPALIALAALVGYPLLYTAVLSVTNDRGGFVGLDNYRYFLGDDKTALSISNTLVYVLGSMVLQILLGTAAGIMLNQKFRGRGLVRSLVLIPWVIPGIVAATTWAWMFHAEFGIINYALMQLHAIERSVGWLTDPYKVLPSLIAVNVWKMFPFVAVMVLAGLQTVPDALYEAARVDGAGFLAEIRYIMLPHLRPVLTSVSLLLVIWGLNGITIIYTMTRGGPANRSLILPIQIFKEAFELFRLNHAAALSLALFLVLFLAILVFMNVFRSAEEKADDAA